MQGLYLACARLCGMYPTAAAGPNQPNYVTNLVQLLGLHQQLVADLADSALLICRGGHYYDRTNYLRYRHFPAVFALRQGEVGNVEVGLDFVAFDTKFVRCPERGEPHYPSP